MDTNTLSGLELRKAVAEKLGYKVEPGSFVSAPPFESHLGALQDAGVIDALATFAGRSTAFDIEGLTLYGEGNKLVTDAEFAAHDYIGDTAGLMAYKGRGKSTSASAALATAICRAYLQLDAGTPTS